MMQGTRTFLLLLVELLALTSQATVTSSKGTFRAAVYEHAVFLPYPEEILSRTEALTLMNKNLDVFRRQTILAKQQGAQIIVFPEDGVYGFLDTRPAQYPYLEDIPDPRKVTWSPCQDPGRYPETEVLHAFSCMAKNNSIYVVADVGDKKSCDIAVDHSCPSDGRYQYNTAVAFGPNGHLLARYHKTHLYYEDGFDPASPEHVYFDTPFGRVGLFICFDSAFMDPAVSLITKHNITIIAFPTAWEDQLPLVSSIGYHSSFARGLGVNFLAADTHLVQYDSLGSGIYTPDGTAVYYYDRFSFSGKLLVADLQILDVPKINQLPPNSMAPFKRSSLLPVRSRSKSRGISNYGPDDTKHERKSKRFLFSSDDEFTSLIQGDPFTFSKLTVNVGSVKVCQGNVCCSLEYEKENTDDLFAFGAFDGSLTFDDSVYFHFQYCALIKCADKKNTSTCGTPTSASNTTFRRIEISGQFETQYVYPQVIVRSADGNLGLTQPTMWNFQGGKLSTSPSLKDPILSASLLGRVYSKDKL